MQSRQRVPGHQGRCLDKGGLCRKGVAACPRQDCRLWRFSQHCAFTSALLLCAPACATRPAAYLPVAENKSFSQYGSQREGGSHYVSTTSERRAGNALLFVNYYTTTAATVRIGASTGDRVSFPAHAQLLSMDATHYCKNSRHNYAALQPTAGQHPTKDGAYEKLDHRLCG